MLKRLRIYLSVCWSEAEFYENSSILVAVPASVKPAIPMAHVEAGLRSFDMDMPEEINRILTDRISGFCQSRRRTG